MAKENPKPEQQAKPAATSFNVSAIDHPHHGDLRTVGTEEEAIRAFKQKNGLDGLGIRVAVTDDAGVTTHINPVSGIRTVINPPQAAEATPAVAS